MTNIDFPIVSLLKKHHYHAGKIRRAEFCREGPENHRWRFVAGKIQSKLWMWWKKNTPHTFKSWNPYFRGQSGTSSSRAPFLYGAYYAGSVNYSNSPEISFYWDHSPHEAWLTMIPVRSQSLTVGVAVKTLPIVQWASTSSCDLLSQLQHLQHLPRLASGLVKVRRYKDQLASAQHTTKNMITFRRLCCVMNDRPRDQWGK